MQSRNKILEHNQALREGRGAGVRRLDDGEVVFKIPMKDMKVLQRIYPDLVSKEHDVRMSAWHKLRRSPVGRIYLVTRTPNQVQRSTRGIIIK